MGQGEELYDVAVVGYGPAGITAAIYSARKKMRVVLFGSLPGGEVRNSGEIENWPGDGTTEGILLAEKLVKHLEKHEDEVTVIKEDIDKVIKDDDSGYFQVCRGNDKYRAKTVIYAAGRRPKHLNVPGEDELRKKGVSYCATCDAPLFTDKKVAVVGGGNTGAEAVIMLRKIASKIYLLHIGDKIPADPVLVDNFKNDPKVEILLNANTTEIQGERMVSGLTFENARTGESSRIKVEGVFVAIGAIPNTEPVKGLVTLDEYGAVVADRYGRTDVAGFFAAGDVTDIRDAQIVVAAGHGCSAALSAGDYIARLN